MARTTTTPAPGNLAALAALIAKLPPNQHYASAAVMVKAAHPGTPRTLATQARGVLRSTNQAVGRGRRYTGITPATWGKAYQAVLAQRAGAKATAQAGKVAKGTKAGAAK